MNWISVKDELPYINNFGNSIDVLACTEMGLMYVLSLTNEGWTDGDGIYYNIVAWMPLPEPPKPRKP